MIPMNLIVEVDIVCLAVSGVMAIMTVEIAGMKSVVVCLT